VIDSGTSLLVGPSSIVKPLIDKVSVKSDCSNVASLPDMTITIDNTSYLLTANDYVLKVTQAGQTECLMGMQAMDFPSGFNYFIFGDVFMRKYPSYFDLDNNTVSFQVAKTLA